MALHIEMTIPGQPEAIEAALEGLIRVNMEIMTHTWFPPLYAAGIRYRLEPAGQDDWQTIDRLHESREGDCEDVMAARVAELRRAGEVNARARVVPVPGRADAFHTFVERGDGSQEDPSKILIAQEDTMADSKPTICVRDMGNHFLGWVDLPLADGRKATVQSLGFDAWGAVTAALHEIVNNPGVMSLISPQAAVAIAVAKRISDMSPDELKKLKDDPKATDAQKTLAKKMLASPSKGGDGKTAPTPAAAKSDWVIWNGPDKGVGATNRAAPPYAASNPDQAFVVTRVHSPGSTQAVPSRGASAPLTAVPSASAPGAVFASTPNSPGSGTRVTGGASTLPDTPAAEAPIDPNTGAYMSPDGSPFIWVPGTDANHPGHYVRASSMPPVPQPGYPPGMVPPGYPPPGYPPGMMPPGYPPGMMPPSYPPGMMPPSYPPGMMPPSPYGYPMPYGVDPNAMQYGYPYPYGMPYGAGGSPMIPYMPPGWWGGIDGMQSPAPLSLDEAAAVTVWGAQSFAPGSFPGYI